MNDLHIKLLELLTLFKEICDRHEIKYFLINGTALGACKYGGFIPWDDDVDVGLLRADYEKFLKVAQSELPDNVFLQNYRTDKYYPHLYSKLRNSDTALIEKGVEHLDINHGIYIDIFPLDSYCKECAQKHRIKKKLYTAIYSCNFKVKNSRKLRVRNATLRMLGFGKKTDKALAKYEALIKNTSHGTEYLYNCGDRQSKGLIPREWYGEGRRIMFEDIELTIPQKTDEYLTHKYGDWRSDPPKDAQYSHHTALICDIEKSYKDYIPIKK